MNCEVIVEFKIEYFDILKQKINLDEVIFFTRDQILFDNIKQLGYDIKHITKYIGDLNPRIDSIFDKASCNMHFIRDHTSKITYKNANIIDGLKLDILDFLIQLETVKSILEEKRKNVVFLYSYEPRYFFFAIPDIARKLGYHTRFGISKILNSELISLDFTKTIAYAYEFAYKKQPKIIKENDDEISDIIECLEFDRVKRPESAFFLSTTESEWYTKPIYPVIDKFKEKNTECILFSWDKRTSTVLENRGYKFHDLSVFMTLSELGVIFLRKKQDIIFQFFNRIQCLSQNVDDVVLGSYLKYFKNNRTILDIADILVCIEIIKAIFEKFSLRSIVVGVDGHMFNDLVCNMAKNYDITTYSFPPAITSIEKILHNIYSASKIFVSGKKIIQEYKKYGADENRFIVTGSPVFDYCKLEKRSNLGKKLVIVANSRMHKNDEEWMSELIYYCNKNSLDILIKMHPMYRDTPDEKAIMDKKIRKIEENCRGLKYEISYDANLTKLLPQASVFITEYSTLGVEASLNEIPMINANMNNELDYYKIPFHKENIALYATTTKELFDGIDKILNDEETKNHLQEGRKKFNYEFNYLNDGRASERVFDIITNSQN